MKFRLAKRTCYCRGCDKKIERNSEKILSLYSFRNRGQHIKLCVDCVKKMNELIKEKKND